MAVPSSPATREQEPLDRPLREPSPAEREVKVPVKTEREPSPLETPKADQDQRREVPPSVETEQPARAAPTAAAPAARPKDPLTLEVEEILSQDLGSMYATLTPQQQLVFKREGEQVASRLRVMLEQAKVHARSILDLIRRWLKLIPGVNKFFLEQEAKIKADKVLSLHARIHGEKQ